MLTLDPRTWVAAHTSCTTRSAANVQVQLHAQDVIMCEMHIDQGMKEANPMDTVLF
jgi:hypothetical protein